MDHWTLKSESDTEKVYAQVNHGAETGRFRYVFADGRTVEVGNDGLHGEATKSRNPHTVRVVAVAAVTVLAVAADVALRVFG